MFNGSIFKQYDIRGIYPSEINRKIAFLIGKFLPAIIKSKKIIIARDVRTSGGDLIKSLIQGLSSYYRKQNIAIYDLGVVSTPLFYFGAGYLNADSGIMITASHNPKDYNGFKIVSKGVKPISFNTGIEKLKHLVCKNYHNIKKGDNMQDKSIAKNIISLDLKSKYINHLASILKIDKNGLTIKSATPFIVDFGNSAVGPIFKIAAKKFNLSYLGLFENPDGNFPARSPDPFKDELNELKQNIRHHKAIFGCAFDGDGDRIIFLDNQGNKIRPDYIGGIVAKEILSNLSKEELKTTKIVYDIRSIWHIPLVVKKCGAKPILWKVGHSLIKEKMRQEQAIFASEFSGHYFFKEFFYSESSILTLLYVLKALAKSKKHNLLATILQDISKPTFHSGEINFITAKKQETIDYLKNKYHKSAHKILELDGLTMVFKEWYFNIRVSGTEDLLRLNLEATSEKIKQNKIKKLTAEIEKITRSKN